MYRTVEFRFSYMPPYRHARHPPQRKFLRTVSTSERCARHVNMLTLQKINYEGDERILVFQELERAMEMMVNLKRLSLSGMAYIKRARLNSATFKLTYLSINPSNFSAVPTPMGRLLPTLKAQTELRNLILPRSCSLTENDITALEEKGSNSGAEPSAIICPRLEYIDAPDQRALDPFLAGRRVKNVSFTRKAEEAVQRVVSPLTLLGYGHLRTLVLFLHTKVSHETLPMVVARHLTSLTRLYICSHADIHGSPAVQSYAPDPLIMSIAQIGTLESITLSTTPRWCRYPSEQEGMIQFLYKSCDQLKEAYVQSSYLFNESHSHYGVGGTLIGLVGGDIANRLAYEPSLFL